MLSSHVVDLMKITNLIKVFCGAATLIVAFELIDGSGAGRALSIGLAGAIGASLGYVALGAFVEGRGKR
jgi:hypothetical protein